MMRSFDGFQPLEFSSFCGFGMPRSGDRGFADWWNAQKGMSVTRIVQQRDPIPHLLPSEFGYMHIGHELWYTNSKNVTCSRDFYEDPECSNSLLPTYNAVDHTILFKINAIKCAIDYPVELVKQFIVPLNL